MKLTKKEKEQLTEWCFSNIDIAKIEKTHYEFLELTGENEIKISEKKAREYLSADDFLTGIARACFHSTSTRKGSGKIIIFENQDWYKY